MKENMETPEQTLSLKLPDIVLKHLRCYGIDPEWFATDVCTNYFREMMNDESNFITTMQAWAEHNGLSLDTALPKELSMTGDPLCAAV